MFNLSKESVLSALIYAVVILISLTVHEFSHGLVSYWLGDPTPKQDGRLSFNPLHHIDIIGAICLLLFHFGWAKPVMINPEYYKKPKLGMALTALAGPLSNFIMAFIGTFILYAMGSNGSALILSFLNYFIIINLGLGVFNLIPIPPLDGFKVLGAILPNDAYFSILRFERYGFIILVLLLWLNILTPILSFGVSTMSNLYASFFSLIF